MCPGIALHANSAYRASFGLRLERAGSSSHPAESSSSSCGPPVRLRLLPTPPRDDAVTFGYGVLAYPDTDFHRANVAPSRAHSPRRRPGPNFNCAASCTKLRPRPAPGRHCLLMPFNAPIPCTWHPKLLSKCHSTTAPFMISGTFKYGILFLGRYALNRN